MAAHPRPARCYRPVMSRKAVTTALLALAVAACGSTGGTAPLTATQLARKIPGCHTLLHNTPSTVVTGDVTCAMGNAGQIEVVTFATTGDEKQWIRGQGNFYGCCIEGRLWAATYDSPSGSYFPRIKRALGGREVTGG